MEYEIKSNSRISLGLKELWLHRELFYFFTWRDIKVKYKQTVLGFLWAILQPVLMTIIFTVFFSRTLHIQTGALPYPVFVLSGLLLWNIFSNGVSNAGNSLVANANIIKKIYFPRLIVPISAVIVSIFDYAMALIVFLVVMFYYYLEKDLNVSFLTLLISIPVSVLLASFSTFGLGTLLSALNLKYRDFRYLIPFFVQVMLFLTPVIYPIQLVASETLQTFLAFNPMHAPIAVFRWGILGGDLELTFVLYSLITSLILFLFGLFYFRKTESYFADLA